MLITLPPLIEPSKPANNPIGALREELQVRSPELLAPGIYRPGLDFNFDWDLRAAGYTLNDYPFRDVWRAMYDLEPGSDAQIAAREAAIAAPADYGVADSWEQIVERWPELLTDERRFVIGMTEVRRVDQSSEGGWRWHKWGEYIGTREPTTEYLADETCIESVWTFHIYEVLTGPGIG